MGVLSSIKKDNPRAMPMEQRVGLLLHMARARVWSSLDASAPQIQPLTAIHYAVLTLASYDGMPRRIPEHLVGELLDLRPQRVLSLAVELADHEYLVRQKDRDGTIYLEATHLGLDILHSTSRLTKKVYAEVQRQAHISDREWQDGVAFLVKLAGIDMKLLG